VARSRAARNARNNVVTNTGLFKPITQWLEAAVKHKRYRHQQLGEVNRGGRGTGFHHRFMGQNPHSARVRVNQNGQEEILARHPNGVYRARVDVRGDDGNWYPKTGASTFFPDNWTPQTVDDTIKNAFKNSRPDPSNPNKWIGEHNGFPVEGFYKQGSGNRDWHTAWPWLPENQKNMMW
jgi:hypothetical protein